MTETKRRSGGHWWGAKAHKKREARRAKLALERRTAGKPTRGQQALTALVDVWLIACVAVVVYGTGQIHAPAGWIVAGVLGAGLAWLYEYGGRQP